VKESPLTRLKDRLVVVMVTVLLVPGVAVSYLLATNPLVNEVTVSTSQTTTSVRTSNLPSVSVTPTPDCGQFVISPSGIGIHNLTVSGLPKTGVTITIGNLSGSSPAQGWMYSTCTSTSTTP